MSLALLVLLCLLAFGTAYLVYGRLLSRLHRLDARARTPAHTQCDGIDFVPTPRFYLLSQHFSAISAAGPIAGPILACLWFGWQPSLLWIVLGCIFIGAMHDFSALIGSVRHEARSVAEIMKRYLNPRTYVLFTFYIWLALIYVIIAFTDITARAFVETLDVAVPAAGEGRLTVPGGGIATSSMLYLVLGLALGLVRKLFRLPLWLLTLVFVPLVGVAIWAGPHFPIDLRTDGAIPSLTWAWLILAYCGVASILPVWLLLQPRGYLGGFFLYVTLVGGLAGIFAGDATVKFDNYKGFYSPDGQPLVPFLFITIACGACSGFHGLVCSGTTSKQIDRESDARAVGYGGMLLEGVVAVIALSCVMSLAPDSPITKMNSDKIFGFGVGTFLSSLGVPLQFAVAFGMLAFATFVYDTLDVCTRLARYLFQEFTGWHGRAAGIAGTLLSLALPIWVISETTVGASGAPIPAYKTVWPLFGSSNQLLAGLTLLALFLWLVRTGRPIVLRAIVGVPMVFMMGMTLTGLYLQLTDPKATPVLLGVGWLLFGLAVWVLIEAVASLRVQKEALE